MVHYTPGQEYRDHVDYFSSADARVRERMGAPPCPSQGPPRAAKGRRGPTEGHRGSIAHASPVPEDGPGGTCARPASAHQAGQWGRAGRVRSIGRACHIGVAGNRVVSVLVYLGCAAEGGETQFTSLGLRVTPTPCAALLWHNFDRKGVLDRRTLHCGRPVLAGEKWGMNIWFRQRPLTPLQAGAERPPAPWTVQPPTQTMPSRAAIESTSLRERCG